MKPNLLIAAVEEAERFLARANDLQDHGEVRFGQYEGGRHAAAVKRASLDLSRALSQLRSRDG